MLATRESTSTVSTFISSTTSAASGKARRWHQNDRRLTIADEVAPCVLGRASCDAGIATIAALLVLSHQLVTAPARHRPRTLLSALNAKSNAASSQLSSD